ncbi:MAG TPA: hypothetical protein VEU78_04060 [Steroidobacteraceae bacterium]|nr:hypothetical protein [Steroidobacteraceae bacterium]
MSRQRTPATPRPAARLLLAVLLAAGGARAQAADLYVICNARVPISAADVRDLFLGEKQFSGAVKLVPVDNSVAQSAFLEKVLQMNAAKYSTAWTKKSFRDGINPPLVAGSDAEALAYVRRTPGACSYVTTPASDVLVVSKQ